MITGEIKNQVDQVWNTFWTGGVSNPLSVIEQFTYLLFAKRLDELHTAKEAQASLLGEAIEDPIFTSEQNHLPFLKQLKPGGRCACIVPDGVLFGSSKAHQQIRKTLVEEQKLEAVISMPTGVFKPYAGVSIAILIFTRTDRRHR